MAQTIYMGDIPKSFLLYALWEHSLPARFFFLSNTTTPPPFDFTAADIATHAYIDYFCGRAIKTDLSLEWANAQGFDANYGAKCFERVVHLCRAAKTHEAASEPLTQKAFEIEPLKGQFGMSILRAHFAFLNAERT